MLLKVLHVNAWGNNLLVFYVYKYFDPPFQGFHDIIKYKILPPGKPWWVVEFCIHLILQQFY
jgi:hypothetical protein